MAEDKTFRYGFIILGLFLLAVGMFIMTADRPQVYITFCVIGGISLIAGVVWSMCQCYPKIAFVPADTDFDGFLSPKALGMAGHGIPEKKGSQPPYSRLEEDTQSPSDYHHIQMKVFGPGEDQGVLSALSLPQSELQAGEGRGPRSEPFMETTVVVHQSPDVAEAENHGGQPEASQMTGPQITAAPWPPLKMSWTPMAAAAVIAAGTHPPPDGEEPWSGKADSQPDRYPDFALIDATAGDEDTPSRSPSPKLGQGTSPNFWPRSKPEPATPKDAASEGGFPDSIEEPDMAPEEPKEEEEDLYYGVKDGPGGTLKDEELFDFEPDS